MEILFLCHRFPYPPNKGDKIRSYALLRHLSQHHRVHVACFVDEPEDFAHADTVRRLAGGECLFVPLKPVTKYIRGLKALMTGGPITTAYFGSPLIAAWVKRVIATHKISGAVVFSSAMAPYLLEASGFDPAKAVLDLVDVDSDKWRQYAAAAKGPERWIYGREAATLLRLERNAARRFGATLLVSPFEAQSFAAMAPESAERIAALENGVDLARFIEGPLPNPYSPREIPIVMTGRMDYRPNADGARWFAREVMPRIAKAVPNSRFYAVGSRPPSTLRRLQGPHVVVTGHTEDVRPYLQHAAVAVAPLRIARGVQNKVLEAMAMEKPVVTTPEATRALSVVHGVDVWVESEPEKFAAAVIAAIKGPEAKRVAASGRAYVERHHNWRHNLAALDDLLARLTGQPPASDAAARAPHPAKRRAAAGAER